jgi:MFS family permease
MVLTFATVSESRDPARPRSIDYAGTVLDALTLMPLILGVSKSGDWGWLSVPTLACFAIAVVAGFAFVSVEQRVKVPLLDLALLRNRILVGATIAILIGAGTINGLMYLLSLYFQDPATLDFSPLQAGLATLPATIGLVVVAPLVPRLAKRLGGRQTIGLGFIVTTGGFVAIGFAQASWAYAAFLLPLVAIAVGMGLSNGPSSSAATASVSANQVGEASGVSNMARYVGAAVATALAATIYGTVIANHQADGESAADSLAAGLAVASWVMAVFSALGILLALFAIRRHRAARGTVLDAAASAAAHLHTLPTTASEQPSAVPGGRRADHPQEEPP